MSVFCQVCQFYGCYISAADGKRRYWPQTTSAATISATKRVSRFRKPGRPVHSGVARIWCGGWDTQCIFVFIWCFDPFSFHKAFVLCVGLLSLVEVVCGRYGLCLWPMWYRLWPISSVADMVCGRYRRNSRWCLVVLIVHDCFTTVLQLRCFV